ncbi:MAG TPA: transglutaminase [Micromonosporaceae bacterium]|nr:transglutaminase [Micromonosporaceae bacterium]
MHELVRLGHELTDDALFQRDDIAGLAAVAHGLLVHEHIASAYGVTLSDEDRDSVHIRPVERLLEHITARDNRPLDTARAAPDRVAGNCRQFTVLMVAMLRAHGIPARARCGFGGYFVNGIFEDHWVCEYWHARQQRWILVDAQIDERQRDMFPIDFDVTDVPRDRFLIAGEAWARCRAGAADPDTFGLSLTNEAGYWWIAGNLMRDAAALSNIELLPWDVWGAMPAPDEHIDDDRRALFDHLAALTRTPDTAFAELRRLCHDDDRLRVPPTVHNHVRDRDEVIATGEPPS